MATRRVLSRWGGEVIQVSGVTETTERRRSLLPAEQIHAGDPVRELPYGVIKKCNADDSRCIGTAEEDGTPALRISVLLKGPM